jgi:hypothetical protein
MPLSADRAGNELLRSLVPNGVLGWRGAYVVGTALWLKVLFR